MNKKIYRIAGGNDRVLFAIVRRQVWHLSSAGNCGALGWVYCGHKKSHLW
ncbi:hypothetical protein [Ignatzschineria ureiclastica]|nr:hypothetical protein [Ignatzschineria ureiclastica]